MKERKETIELLVEEDDENGEERKEIDWWIIWEKYRWGAVFLFGALVLGVLAIFSFRPSRPEIELLSAENETAAGGTIFVDLAGSVEKPGVYELLAGARVNDLLIRAGGLAVGADREWVARNLNLAQVIVDGAKIYIPTAGETKIEGSGGVEGVAVTAKINLNTATVTQLDSLWGIGEARAGSIIAGRPYQKVEELLEKKIVPANVYERIKGEITVY